jgi:hypothetical protein
MTQPRAADAAFLTAFCHFSTPLNSLSISSAKRPSGSPPFPPRWPKYRSWFF